MLPRTALKQSWVEILEREASVSSLVGGGDAAVASSSPFPFLLTTLALLPEALQ